MNNELNVVYSCSWREFINRIPNYYNVYEVVLTKNYMCKIYFRFLSFSNSSCTIIYYVMFIPSFTKIICLQFVDVRKANPSSIRADKNYDALDSHRCKAPAFGEERIQ